MGKVLNSLRNLGQKMTGVPITSVRVDKALNEIAENYSGGGGGGGMTIVHATVDEYNKTATLDKTFAEIAEHGPNTLIFVGGSSGEPFYTVYSLRTFGTIERDGELLGTITFARYYMDGDYMYDAEITISKFSEEEEIEYILRKSRRPYE